MNRKQLVTAAARRSDLTRRQVDEAVEVIFDTIAEALATGDTVVLRYFGRFSTWERRQMVQDFQGQVHQVDVRQPVFGASAALRRRLKEENG